MFKVEVDKKIKPTDHVRCTGPIVHKFPGLVLYPACKPRHGFSRKWPYCVRFRVSHNWLGGASVGLREANPVVRGGGCSWVVRLDCRADYWLQIILANVSDKHIKDRLLVCRF